MSETYQHIIGLLFLALVFLVTRYGVGLRMKKAAQLIVGDLEDRQAFDVYTAVSLNYAKPTWKKFGLRDFRPKALESLVKAGVVVQSGPDRFYLSPDFSTGEEMAAGGPA